MRIISRQQIRRRPAQRIIHARDTGVSAIFTSTTAAPRDFANSANPATGYTTADVPTTSSTSASCDRSLGALPNRCRKSLRRTTPPGPLQPPHAQRGGSSGSRALPSSRSRPHSVQRTIQISPWTFKTFRLPARSCKPSTFCVINVKFLNAPLEFGQRPMPRVRLRHARSRCAGSHTIPTPISDLARKLPAWPDLQAL